MVRLRREHHDHYDTGGWRLAGSGRDLGDSLFDVRPWLVPLALRRADLRPWPPGPGRASMIRVECRQEAGDASECGR